LTVEQALQQLQAATVQTVPLSALKTDDALQPRVIRMVPFKAQGGVESRSEEHIGSMRLALEASHSIQLKPVLVAEMEEGLFVVDGHHRLKAYRQAHRQTIPARVYPMDRQRAVLVSKLVNCTERALPMHSEQRLDAAWQYLAAVTGRGSREMPPVRTIVGLFGIGYGTAQRMRHKIPEVNPKDWNPEALDGGTGWPRWRYVREAGAGWLDMKEKMDVEQVMQHEAEKLARKIGALMEKATPEAVRRAIHMLGIEAQLDTVNEDRRDFNEATAESSDF